MDTDFLEDFKSIVIPFIIINLKDNIITTLQPQKKSKLSKFITIHAFFKKDTRRLKVMENDYFIQREKKKKKAGVAILVSDKKDIKTKTITRDKEGHFMIKGSIQKEDIILLNVYASNVEASKHIQQILTDIKGEVDSNIVIARDFTPH